METGYGATQSVSLAQDGKSTWAISHGGDDSAKFGHRVVYHWAGHFIYLSRATNWWITEYVWGLCHVPCDSYQPGNGHKGSTWPRTSRMGGRISVSLVWERHDCLGSFRESLTRQRVTELEETEIHFESTTAGGWGLQ